MKHKKIFLIAVILSLVLISIMTYLYVNKETDITYQGTFLIL
ncbi:MAG: hypothetical protein N4A63_02020 [Vallitalea sp.]|jgi:uncharacterized membrane-anchored protein|nr:hypothetical protein [Vallitalea sp.]